MTNPQNGNCGTGLKINRGAQEEVQEYTVDCIWLECLSCGTKILKMKL